jgi:uncharacterized protein
VTFEEAASVFSEPVAAIFDDEVHSIDEQREIIIGHSAKSRIVVVSFTERDGAIRIISARKVTKRERKDHEENTSR